MVASKSNYLGLVAQTPHEVCVLQHHLSISSRKAVSTECPAVTLEEKAAILLASLFNTVCTATTTSNRGVLVLLRDGRKHNTPAQIKRLFQGHSVTSFPPSIDLWRNTVLWQLRILAKGRIGAQFTPVCISVINTGVIYQGCVQDALCCRSSDHRGGQGCIYPSCSGLQEENQKTVFLIGVCETSR